MAQLGPEMNISDWTRESILMWNSSEHVYSQSLSKNSNNNTVDVIAFILLHTSMLWAITNHEVFCKIFNKLCYRLNSACFKQEI